MKINRSAICLAAIAAIAALASVPVSLAEDELYTPQIREAPSAATAHDNARKSVNVQPQNYYGKIAQRMARMLPRYHVLQQPLDDEISRRAWTNIVTYYDFDHSVFLQSDLDRLARHELTIDDELLAGDVYFGYEIYNLYCERLRERIDFATNLLAAADWDFSQNETYRVRRKDAPWPKSREEAEEHWRRRMKNEVLAQILSRELDAEDKAEEKAEAQDGPEAPEKADAAVGQASAEHEQVGKPEGEAEDEDEAEEEYVDTGDDEPVESDPRLTPEQNLIKKYRQYATVLCEPDEEAVLQHYLSAVARAYDPHSDYLSPASKEDFDMDMNLSLCGVGAVLSMDDGALKIAEIMPGGPIDVDGRIREGDKIIGVQQEGAEMEDITWQPMKKTIRKIRGEKGTRVTLEIIPRSDPTGATKKLIEIVRDEIKLEDQAATGRVEKVEHDGRETRLGYVYLPGFYGTMDKRPTDEGFRSCAQDVARYLAEFNAQDVEGLVLDLRGDGGGSLREAVMLSALFVPSGPVVQIRDTRTVQPLDIPRGNPVAFRKPVVVLTDRASASASEIVAGHLRDTGRAIVLGDTRTHGKGTVQTVMGMGPDKYGSMKITTARFYRIDGRSTQVKGVEADIRLPSLLDSLDIGEDKLTYALPFTRIRKADFVPCWNLDAHIPELAALSALRLGSSERYKRHLECVDGMKAIADREEVPLERGARLAMMRSDRALRELEEDNAARAERAKAEGREAGDDDDADADTEAAKTRRRRNRIKEREDDIVLDEAFNILSDLVWSLQGATLPPTRMDWYNAILGF